MFKWGVIGTGNIANTVCREIVAGGRHKVAAVYSRTLSKAQKFAEKFGAKCYDDAEAFFADGDIEAVYIATPHSAHYKYLLQSIRYGVPALVEKPFTVNAAQAETVFAAAAEKKVFVCEAMWTRFLPVVRKVVERVEQGKIGRVTGFDGAFTMPLRLIKPFISDRVYKAEYAGGAILDLGVYPIAFSEMLMGMPDKIDCCQKVIDGVDYEDVIELKYADRVSKLYSSFTGLKSFTGVVRGSAGKIIIPNFSRPVKAAVYSSDGKKEILRGKKGYVYEFDACAADILAGRTVSTVMKPQSTINVLKIVDECRRQNGLVYPEEVERV